LARAMLRHLPTLLAAAQQGNWTPGYSRAPVVQLWGDVTHSEHVLSVQPIEWGFRFTEPQCTKALAHFLNGDGDETQSRARCAAFVRALYRAAGKQDEGRMNPESAKPNTLTVEAERSIGKKRVDIALEWEDRRDVEQDNRRLILIECKFNHHVTDGQLSGYRKFASSRAKVGSRELFLVVDQMTSHTAQTLRKNNDWAPLTCRALIRRLERELAVGGVQVDGDFVRLRRTIWGMSDKNSL